MNAPGAERRALELRAETLRFEYEQMNEACMDLARELEHITELLAAMDQVERRRKLLAELLTPGSGT